MTGKDYAPPGRGIRQSFTAALRPAALAFAVSFAIFATMLFSVTDYVRSSSLTFYTTPERNLHTPVFDSTKEFILSRCALAKMKPGPLASFHSRDESDRYEPGTNATLIRNAMIFTGRENGTEVVHGSILLDKGIIKGLGKISWRVIDNTPNLTVVDAMGAWVTPGLGMVTLLQHLLCFLGAERRFLS